MNLIDKYYPNTKDVGIYFKEYLQRYITPDTRILEVGCGRQSFGEDYYKKAKWRVGIDPDKEALEVNKLMDEKFCVQVENMPQFNEKFNLVVAQWVLEHVKNPDVVIEKLAQNSTAGAYFLFMTTNMFSPLILLSHISPTGFKKFLKNKLLNIPENETYPTYYRINTPKKLDFYMNKHGFKKVDVKEVGVLTYFAVNRPVLFTKAFLDKWLFERFSFFKKFSTHIVGVYQKV